MGHISYPNLLFAWSDVKLYAEEESDSTFKMAVIAVLAPEHTLVHFYDYQSVEHFQKFGCFGDSLDAIGFHYIQAASKLQLH